MNRGRGRAVDGGGGRWQRTVRGRSSGSGGRSTIQRDHDECNKYSYNGNPSGGRGSGNQNKVEESDQKSVNGRRGNEGTRSNSYRQGGCYAPVRIKEEDRVRQFDQGQAAPKGACGSSRSNVSSALSINITGVDIPSLYDQARPGVLDINVSNTQLCDGGGGRWQCMVRGRSSGSGGRSTIQRNHDECNKYSYNGNPSGGRGSSNQNKVEESDQKSVNGRHGNEGTRGNSYRQGGCYAPVRSKEEDRVRQFDQGQAAPKGACGSSRSNVSSAYSINNTRVDIHSLYDQARPGVLDINVSNTQLCGIPVNEVEKGTDFITERLRSMNVSQAEIWQPLEPVINSTPYGNEKNVLSDVPGNKCSDPSEVTGYDICFAKTETTVTLKPSLFAKNREKRNEMKRATEGRRREILQSGLILLKNHLSITEQAQIVNICRKLGQGHGGFYQPGYQDGAKLHLKMMCLGKNWDPETSQYVDVRPVDGAKPPPLPFEFTQLVHRAIQESHQLIKEQVKTAKVENILPSMSPDLCIVNFYTASGRLGLHQDRDESEESLKERLPVVSFSIGDTAEFLYSEQWDVDKADKVLLESGDVLLFGGKSRHIFHGVEKILPNTAPKSLLGESNLRPGRLNLTFRQF